MPTPAKKQQTYDVTFIVKGIVKVEILATGHKEAVDFAQAMKTNFFDVNECEVFDQNTRIESVSVSGGYRQIEFQD